MMRGMAQRAIAFTASMTLLLTCPSLNMPASAEDTETDKVFDQTQPLTVVAKRITGDDTYFEISLEVNGDYDDYSSVGVVLRYDPEYITPADSWADGAPAADMTENTSWATRRALPTLGVDTWTTHTALAYEETEAQADADKPYGYLYLSAEHPRPEEGPDPDATVAPEPALEPMLGTESPSPDPDASPKPETGSAPVVAARFMYKTDGEKDGAAVKKELTDAWLKGANETNGLNDDKTENWDYDWRANKILTIAGDGIAEKSPAQYPFVIYTQNYEEKAFMFDFPSDTLSPAAELRAVDDYKYVVGSSIAEANRLKDTDIAIVTLEGESALKTGGLSLGDIYTILFFDWDDSLLGTLTAGVGEDPTEAVHNYTKEKFIHPELRNLNYAEMSETEKKERKNNYRGEYPENGPDTGDPLAKSGKYGDGADEPGSKYPLTNKLDYAFAGKNLLDADHPYTFAYGWTQVLPDAPDYSDKIKYPGQTADILPKAMEDTITSQRESTWNETYGWAPELDESGEFVEPDAAIPTWIACDFSALKQEDLEASGGNLYVKAVYTECEWLGRNNSSGADNTYTTVGPMTTETLSSVGNDTIYGLSFAYERINKFGHGVTRIIDPAVQMDLTQIGATASTPLEILVENSDTIDVTLTPSNAVSSVGYILKDRYTLNVITGGKRSNQNGLDEKGGEIKLTGKDGMLYKDAMASLLKQAADKLQLELDTGKPYTDDYNTAWTDSTTWDALKLVKTTNKSTGKTTPISTLLAYRAAQRAIVELIRAIKNNGQSVEDITWYQMQYFIIKITAKTTKPPEFLDSDAAREWLVENHPAAVELYESYV